jgi:hypothetical protein
MHLPPLAISETIRWYLIKDYKYYHLDDKSHEIPLVLGDPDFRCPLHFEFRSKRSNLYMGRPLRWYRPQTDPSNRISNFQILGAICESGDDCSDELDCIEGACGGIVPWTTLTQVQTGRLTPLRTTQYFTLGLPTSASCAWIGHCAGTDSSAP